MLHAKNNLRQISRQEILFLFTEDEEWFDVDNVSADYKEGLEKLGVLQAANQMIVEELLNPSDESVTMDKATDDEIYEILRCSMRMHPQTTYAITMFTTTHL